MPEMMTTARRRIRRQAIQILLAGAGAGLLLAGQASASEGFSQAAGEKQGRWTPSDSQLVVRDGRLWVPRDNHLDNDTQVSVQVLSRPLDGSPGTRWQAPLPPVPEAIARFRPEGHPGPLKIVNSKAYIGMQWCYESAQSESDCSSLGTAIYDALDGTRLQAPDPATVIPENTGTYDLPFAHPVAGFDLVGSSVVKPATGETVFTFDRAAIARRVARRGASVDGLGLNPDGSLTVFASVKRRYRKHGMYAVYVDPTGKIRRASPLLRGATSTSAWETGGRVVVMTAGPISGRGKRRTPVCNGAWVTNLDGTRGAPLADAGQSDLLRVTGRPGYWDGSHAVWVRYQLSPAGTRTYGASRFIVRDLAGERLTRAGRPSCRDVMRGLRSVRSFRALDDPRE